MNKTEYYLNNNLNCEVKIPNKIAEFLQINNFLSEYYTQEDKIKVIQNLGIDKWFESFKSEIEKLIPGKINWSEVPTLNETDKVLSSDSVYKTLLKYVTKDELTQILSSLDVSFPDQIFFKDSKGGIHSYNSNNTNLGKDALNLGEKTQAVGERSTAIGTGGIARGKNSFVNGEGTVSNNSNESAIGQYNQSNSDTIFSVGVGDSNTNRKNAFEIRKDGNIYYLQNGEYKNLQSVINAIPSGGSVIVTSSPFSKVTNPVQENGVIKEGIVSEFSKVGDYKSTGQGALNIGQNSKSSGDYSNAQGNNTQSTGNYSHSEGNQSKSIGESSHAEGNNSSSDGNYSHSEGQETHSYGIASHSEGKETQAKGNYSHSEGIKSQSQGQYSHSEGDSTIASGYASHTEGLGTITSNSYEHASGKYNKSNSDTLYSIGIGTSNANRKNAFEVKENGDIYIYRSPNSNNFVCLQEFLDELLSTPTGLQLSDLEPYATKVYVDEKFNSLSSINPGLLNILYEVQQLLNDDEDLANQILNALANKADKSEINNFTVGAGLIKTSNSVVKANLLNENRSTRTLGVDENYYPVEIDKNGRLAVGLEKSTTTQEYQQLSVDITFDGSNRDIPVTLTYGDIIEEQIWNGYRLVFQVPLNVNYTISVPEVTGYYITNKSYSGVATTNYDLRTFEYKTVGFKVRRYTNQGEFPACKITLSYDNKTQVIQIEEGNNSWVSAKTIPYNTSVVVSFEDIEGYQTPQSQNVVVNSANTEVEGQYLASKVYAKFTSNHTTNLSDTEVTIAYTYNNNTIVKTLQNNKYVYVPCDATNITCEYITDIPGFKKPSNKIVNQFTSPNDASSLLGNYSACLLTASINKLDIQSNVQLVVSSESVQETILNSGDTILIPTGENVTYYATTVNNYTIIYNPSSPFTAQNDSAILQASYIKLDKVFTKDDFATFTGYVKSNLDNNDSRTYADTYFNKMWCYMYYTADDLPAGTTMEYWNAKAEEAGITLYPNQNAIKHNETVYLIPGLKYSLGYISPTYLDSNENPLCVIGANRPSGCIFIPESGVNYTSDDISGSDSKYKSTIVEVNVDNYDEVFGDNKPTKVELTISSGNLRNQEDEGTPIDALYVDSITTKLLPNLRTKEWDNNTVQFIVAPEGYYYITSDDSSHELVYTILVNIEGNNLNYYNYSIIRTTELNKIIFTVHLSADKYANGIFYVQNTTRTGHVDNIGYYEEDEYESSVKGYEYNFIGVAVRDLAQNIDFIITPEDGRYGTCFWRSDELVSSLVPSIAGDFISDSGQFIEYIYNDHLNGTYTPDNTFNTILLHLDDVYPGNTGYRNTFLLSVLHDYIDYNASDNLMVAPSRNGWNWSERITVSVSNYHYIYKYIGDCAEWTTVMSNLDQINRMLVNLGGTPIGPSEEHIAPEYFTSNYGAAYYLIKFNPNDVGEENPEKWNPIVTHEQNVYTVKFESEDNYYIQCSTPWKTNSTSITNPDLGVRYFCKLSPVNMTNGDSWANWKHKE